VRPHLLSLGLLALIGAGLPSACSLAEEATAVAVAQPAGAAGVPGQASMVKECGACHLPYLPGFMPGRSWVALMAHLPLHFGEDASLDPATARAITAYLTNHAADSRSGSKRVLSGLADATTPERITDMPWWRRRHRRLVAHGDASGDGIRVAAKCQACHNANGSMIDDD
jgi:hypothetical protein